MKPVKNTNFLLVLLLLLVLVESDGVLGSPPEEATEDELREVAESLKKFVDRLPHTRRILGYKPSRSGEAPTPGNLTIGMYQIRWKFHRDLPATRVFAYGTSRRKASVPGPLIEALHGVPTYVTWKNYLPQKHILATDPNITSATPKFGGVPTVVHLHGGVQPPTSDGNALSWFTANFNETGPNWHYSGATYMYPNAQHSRNLWYHDHALGLTRVNLLAGLIAPYVIRNPELDENLNLPSGPRFDRHLLVFDRNFNSDGSLYINRTGNIPELHQQWNPEYFGDAIIVNGKAWPYLKVQRRKYRFRITNASNARYFNFSLTNGLSFTVLGSDGSYLKSPVTSSSIMLAPAETTDVVMDFSKTSHGESVLTNDAVYPFPSGEPTDELNGEVMKFIIDRGSPVNPDTSTIPASLSPYLVESVEEAFAKAVVTRHIALNEVENEAELPMKLNINGRNFSDPVTETPKAGSTEVWEVINLTDDNHPLHIHLAVFQAMQVRRLDPIDDFKGCMVKSNDAIACNISSYITGTPHPIPEYERTWKNIVKIANGTVTTVVVKFNLVTNDEGYPFDATVEPGYVYHCHILDHEDNEMMRPLKLLP